MTAVLSFLDVSFAFGATPVVSDLSLSLSGGEFVGLIGPNGCGKTTLLRLARGLLRPQRGEVRLWQQDPCHGSARQRAQRLAVVAQRDELVFPFTVQDVVLMGRAPFRRTLGFERPADVCAAEQAIADLGLQDLIHRPFPSLSGGERQRVLLARALAQQPELLLLDEPTTAMDIRHQVEVFERLRQRHNAGGLTVLTVLHDLNLATLYCDRVILLDRGRVHADGPAESVVTYANVRQVYGCEVYVGLNELNGKAFMVPMRPAAAAR